MRLWGLENYVQALIVSIQLSFTDVSCVSILLGTKKDDRSYGH